MAHLSASIDLDVVVELGRFANVELFERGIYAVRVGLKGDNMEV